jgi:hypothetical protein
MGEFLKYSFYFNMLNLGMDFDLSSVQKDGNGQDKRAHGRIPGTKRCGPKGGRGCVDVNLVKCECRVSGR